MSWDNFLDSVTKEYQLPEALRKVLLCLKEEQSYSEKDIRKNYCTYHNHNIEANTLKGNTRRLIAKLHIEKGRGQLHRLRDFLAEEYQIYKNKDSLFSEVGLSKIHTTFPNNIFSQKLKLIIISEDKSEKKVDILQTFAPNLDRYQQELIECLRNGISVRILLAWPYSQAAKLRESALVKYTGRVSEYIDINSKVIENLEILESVLKEVGITDLLQIRLYDTLPSMSMYRAGNYLLVGLFLHGVLAIDTFQLELNLKAQNQLISGTFAKDFELVWESSRELTPYPDNEQLWRNDLRVLFL